LPASASAARFAEFVNNQYGTSSYKDWGNEPFVAVNPTNTDDVFISSFASFSSTTMQRASIFYSTNSGAKWNVFESVPAPLGILIPGDWTFAYDSTGTLHGAVLGRNDRNVYQGMTTDPTSLGAWMYTQTTSPPFAAPNAINTAASAGSADQPWIAVRNGKVFVAYDDFSSGVAERVAVSNDNGKTFSIDNPITNTPIGNNVNPGTRIATDGIGNIYSVFGDGEFTVSPGVHLVNYYLNRSKDGGMTWDFNDLSVAHAGMPIDFGASTQACPLPPEHSGLPGCSFPPDFNNWFAGVNDLLGNITAIAADKSGDFVYVLIGLQDADGVDRIYLVTYENFLGTDLVKASEIPISIPGERAALPAITVLDNGTIVMSYETYGADGKVHVHVASSKNHGFSIASDIVEYSFTPLPLDSGNYLPTLSGSPREFGDYDFLTSIGDAFFGTFAGVGDVNAGGIDTRALIDPFFFSGTDVAAVPEPGSWLLVLTGLVGTAWLRRRQNRC
jgi:hypothetical protein